MPVDIEKLRISCIYEAAAPPAAILSDLDEISKADERFAQVRASRRKTAWSLLGVGLLGIPLMFVAEELGPLGGLMMLFGIGAFIVMMIRAFTYARGFSKARNRVTLLDGIVRRVKTDCDPKVPVQVRVLFNNEQRLISEAPWPVRKNGKQRFLENTWVTVDGRLLDGTKFSERVHETVRARSFVTTRGKHKTKYRSWYLITLRLVYPPERYGDLTAIGPRLAGMIQLTQAAQVRGAKASGKALGATVRMDDAGLLLANSTRLFLGLYKALNAAHHNILKGGAH